MDRGSHNTVRKHLRAFYTGLAVASKRRAAYRYHAKLGAYDVARSEDVEGLAHDAASIRLHAVRVKPGSGMLVSHAEVQAIAVLANADGSAGVFVHRMFSNGDCLVDLYNGFACEREALDAVMQHEDAEFSVVDDEDAASCGKTCQSKRARLLSGHAEAVQQRLGPVLLFYGQVEVFPTGTTCLSVPHIDVDAMLQEYCVQGVGGGGTSIDGSSVDGTSVELCAVLVAGPRCKMDCT